MAFLRCSLLWQRLISKAILSKHYHMINLICKTKCCKYKSHSFGCFHLWAVAPTFVLQWSHPLVNAHGNQNLPSHVERPGGKQLGLHKYGIPTVSNGYHFPYETRLECKDPSKSRRFGDIQPWVCLPRTQWVLIIFPLKLLFWYILDAQFSHLQRHPTHITLIIHVKIIQTRVAIIKFPS